MFGRLADVAKWLSAAVVRRAGGDPVLTARLEATIGVVEQDYAAAGALHEATGDDRLRAVAELFGLDEFERDLLLLAAAADLDANIALAYGLLRGGSAPGHPSIGLALELLGVSSLSGSARARFADGARLASFALIEVGTSGPWLSREFRCPDRVVTHLAGVVHPDRRLGLLVIDPTPMTLPGAGELVRALEQGSAFVWVHAPPGTAGLTMVAGALSDIDVRCLCLTVPTTVEGGPASLLRLADAEAAGWPRTRCWSWAASDVCCRARNRRRRRIRRCCSRCSPTRRCRLSRWARLPGIGAGRRPSTRTCCTRRGSVRTSASGCGRRSSARRHQRARWPACGSPRICSTSWPGTPQGSPRPPAHR